MGIDTEGSFLASLCLYRERIRLLFMFSVFFLSLTLAAFLVLERGTGAYAVNVMNLVGLTFFAFLFGGLMKVCDRY